MKLFHQVQHHQHLLKILIVIDQHKRQLFLLEQMLIYTVYNKLHLMKIEQQQQHERQDVLVMVLLDNKQALAPVVMNK
jgi:hypothetical protein